MTDRRRFRRGTNPHLKDDPMAPTAPTVNGRVLNRVRSNDPRNGDYPIRRLLAAAHVPRTRKTWQTAYLHPDQGATPHCTDFEIVIARLHSSNGWHRWRPKPNTVEAANTYAHGLYPRTQALDEFPDTPPEDGSSGTGAARAAKESGLISGFYHADTVEDVIDSVITHGPGGAGSDWTDGMFTPGANGIIRATGSVAGGHEYCITGYNPDYFGLEVFKIFNSWGPGWGRNSVAYLPVRGDQGFEGLWERGADFVTYTAQ